MEEELRLQLIDTFSKLVTTAFGLIAVFAWNSAVTEMINSILGRDDRVVGMFVYAAIVTVISVISVVFLTRSLRRLRKIVQPKKEDDDAPKRPSS